MVHTVDAARRGEPDAWRSLYREHAPPLLTWLRTVPSGDSAASPEDVAADTWLTAAAKIADFRGGDDDFAPWLFTIARHHLSNQRRKAGRRRTDPVDVDAVGDAVLGSTPADQGRVDDHDRVRHLLRHLSPREAQVVACLDVVGLDVATTAAALGMRPTAVRVARHRGLGRLRGLLGDDRPSPGED